MKNLRTKLLSSVVTISMVTLIAACEPSSESSSPWVKSESPWGKRTAAVTETAEAPAADTYKEELANIDTGSTAGVEMGYQAEKVESVVPAEAIAEEPAAPPVTARKSAPVVAAEPVSSDAGGDLKNVPASYYTVQVIASVDENYVYTFAKKSQLSTRYVVPTIRNGKTWYVLLLDVYPDKAAAKVALDDAATTLPNKPWMRTVGSVQAIMP